MLKNPQNSSKATFDKNISNLLQETFARLDRGYPHNLIDRILSEIDFAERNTVLKQSNKERKEILPFVTQYQPYKINRYFARYSNNQLSFHTRKGTS